MISSLIRKAAVPSDAFRNPTLDNVSTAAFQDSSEFVARAVFPTIPVTDQAGYYYEINMDTIAQNKAAARAPGTVAREGTWDLSKTSFLCEQFGYRERLPEELIASTGAAAAADITATMSVAEVLAIAEEYRFAQNFFVTGKWARDMAGASSTVANTSYIYWSTGATSTPINDVLNEGVTMKLAGKRYPNTMILGAQVAPILLTHPTIVNRVNSGQTPGQGADPTLNDLAKFFKVERVLIASAVYNTAAEGATASNSFILDGKSAWLGYVNPQPAVRAPSAGYRFACEGLAGNPMGIRNWKYWDQPSRSWFIETAVDDTFKLVASKLGTFFTAIVA